MKEQTEGEKKLSQLLGEYMEEKKKNPEGFLEISTVLMCAGGKALDVYMVSKYFGFIERLVKNNKINLDEIERYGFFGYTYYQSLLMLLAISENPIEDLIDYLR